MLPDFQLEIFFSRWEFEARHNLAASDAQTLTIGELLAILLPGPALEALAGFL